MKISTILAHLLGTALIARMADDAPAATSDASAQEAGTAAAGEPANGAAETAPTQADTSLPGSTSADAPPASASSTLSGDAATLGDAPTVAELQSALNEANATIADLQAQLAAAQAQAQAEHPIHTLLGEIEAEIERPGAILKARVKSLINDARALF